ncbi:MAG: response regulator [Planctomycetota bacterium]
MMEQEFVVLIAEDDAGHFALVKKNLWRSCVTKDILHFKDGQEILDFLFMRGDRQKRQAGGRYVLLLDIRMPKVDGREVLRQLKEDDRLCKIPVIMLTTTEDEGEIQRCYEIGCSFYIVKPVDYNKFMEAMDRLGRFLSLEGIKVAQIN